MEKNKKNREKFLDRQNKQQRRNSRYNYLQENTSNQDTEKQK